MTDRDFDDVFGGKPSAKFTQRIGRADAGAANALETDEPGLYRAYGFLPTGNVGETCEVSRWVEGTQIPEGIEFQYRFLMQIGFVGEEQLRLMLPDCIVVISGKHLRELRKKLARRQVTFIQQYSSKVWPEGSPKNETIIDKIDVVRPEPVQPYGKNS